MPSRDLPISHATHLVPYVRFLDEIGAPVEAGLEQMHLPGDLMATPNCFVPTQSLFGFVGLMARKEGIDDIGFRVACDTGLDLLGSKLAGQVAQSPTLFHSLRTFCELVSSQASEVRSSFVEDGDEVRFCFHRTFQPGTLGYTQTEWIGVMAMVNVVRIFAGLDWAPDRISLGTRRAVPELATATFSNTRFVTRQAQVYIAFPRSMLSLSRHPLGHGTGLDQGGRPPTTLGHGDPAATFDGRLVQCLEPHLADGYPHVALAAELADTSVRTLQRRLSSQGLTYSTIVGRARFNVASRMLGESDVRMIEIALATAYSDPSHFARAFRRLAGVSPREYRNQARQRSAL